MRRQKIRSSLKQTALLEHGNTSTSLADASHRANSARIPEKVSNIYTGYACRSMEDSQRTVVIQMEHKDYCEPALRFSEAS